MRSTAATGGESGELPVLPEIYERRPWYHDFRRLGLRTDFDDPVGLRQRLRGLAASWVGWVRGARSSRLEASVAPPHRVNQQVKERRLLPWLERCLEELGPSARCLDLFCADGYYSCTIAREGRGATVLGIDRDESEIAKARVAARALGLVGTSFSVAEVGDFLSTTEEAFDLVLCAGGLYHLSEPWRLLEEVRRVGRRYLVVQSVVTLETEAADHFVSPAPRWRHGSRFTHARLRYWLEEAGWGIVDSDRAELPGNPRLSDRGASFFLCAQ